MITDSRNPTNSSPKPEAPKAAQPQSTNPKADSEPRDVYFTNMEKEKRLVHEDQRESEE
jgi:hypothetical protein